MTLTTPALISFLQLREGFRKKAYDDAQPHIELTAETEIKGTITIGYGTTRYPDGSPVEWDDKVTKSEAVDYLAHFIRETVEPALENLIHRPLAGCQYDALGSCIYQYGEGEVAGWKLIQRINAGEDWKSIALEWVNGTVMWRGEPMFWGRRIMELFMFLGIDWRGGANVPVLSDPLEAAEAMGFDGELPKPAPIVHEDLFEPEKPDMSDPTPESPMTMDDRQFLSAKAVGYDGTYADFMGHRTVVTKRNAIEAPRIDVTKPPKPMEDSETHRGLAKQTAGKENITLGTTLTGAAATAATVRELTRDATATVETASPVVGGFTANHFILIGLCIGIPLFAYGLFKAFRGWQIARQGREDGTQLKV